MNISFDNALLDLINYNHDKLGHNYGSFDDKNCQLYCHNCKHSVFTLAFSSMTCNEWIIKNIIE